MNEREFLERQATIARRAFANTWSSLVGAVKRGEPLKQVARAHPAVCLGVAATAGAIGGLKLAGMLRRARRAAAVAPGATVPSGAKPAKARQAGARQAPAGDGAARPRTGPRAAPLGIGLGLIELVRTGFSLAHAFGLLGPGPAQAGPAARRARPAAGPSQGADGSAMSGGGATGGGTARG